MIITIYKISIHGKKIKGKKIDLCKVHKIANSGASLIFKSKNGRQTEAEYLDMFCEALGIRTLENYSWHKHAESHELGKMERYFCIDDDNSDKVFKYIKENNIHIYDYNHGEFVWEL